MSIPGTTRLGSPVAPSDARDEYPTHFSGYGKGGFHTGVQTLAMRDAIPLLRREEGMMIYVIENQKYYRWANGVYEEVVFNTIPTTNYVAGEDISRGNVIYYHADGKVYLADSSLRECALLIVGLADTTVLAGSSVHVVSYGHFSDSSFAFAPTGVVLVGREGLLSQGIPSESTFSKVMGVAVTATTIMLLQEEPIYLV